MRITAVDARSSEILDVREVAERFEGEYFRYRIRGEVRFEFENVFGHAMVAAALFDRHPAPPPVVSIVNPTEGATFSLGDGVVVSVEAGISPPAEIEYIELFANGELVEVLDTTPFDTRMRPPSVGETRLIARARGSDGTIAESVPVDVGFSGSSSAGQVVFDGKDSATGGDWIGVYGDDGYLVMNDSEALPGYIDFNFVGGQPHVFYNNTTDSRALQRADGQGRTAAAWYSNTSFDVELHCTDGNWHHVAMNLVDWGNGGRRFTVEMLDAANGTVLDSRLVSDISDGIYLKWFIRGDVVARFTSIVSNTLVNGLFFQKISGYESWVRDYFAVPPSDEVSLQDPDGDEVANLLEYKFGQSPLLADETGSPKIIKVGGEVCLAWDEAPFTEDVSVAVEVSDDLVHWDPAGGSLGEITRRRLADRDEVVAKIVLGSERRFFRLVAVRVSDGD